MAIEERKQKWDKILVITPLFALIMFGFVLSEISGNVLFVKRIGSEFLPYTYVLNTIFGTLTALVVAGSLGLGRFNVVRLIQMAALLGAAALFGNYVLIQNDLIVGYWIYIVLVQILYMVLASIMIWDLGFKICTPFEAKRVFGFFSLGASVGGDFSWAPFFTG